MGVTWATFPTSSSACMILLILATGNLVFTSMPPLALEERTAPDFRVFLVWISGTGSGANCHPGDGSATLDRVRRVMSEKELSKGCVA